VGSPNLFLSSVPFNSTFITFWFLTFSHYVVSFSGLYQFIVISKEGRGDGPKKKNKKKTREKRQRLSKKLSGVLKKKKGICPFFEV
jgi:hypothetical protein